MSGKPAISIITVVYNAAGALLKTIESISSQTFRDFEYIVIDGGSTDGTIDLINNNKTLVTRWISEKDRGLYDAMNKAIAMASGKYLIFLNAGDRFYKPDTLQKIFEKKADADIYYGQTMIVDSDYNELGLRRLKAPEVLTWKNLINGMLVCHQSFIVKKDITLPYDLKYKISADYDWMIKCLKKAAVIVNTDQIVSEFTDGGLNKKRMKTGLLERFLIMKNNFGLVRTILVHVYFPFRFVIFYLFHGRV
jgi:glycosyltransferase involved in cell wall biosynthesis